MKPAKIPVLCLLSLVTLLQNSAGAEVRLWQRPHAPETTLAQTLQAFPFLSDFSAWRSYLGPGAGDPWPWELGSFGLGNGRVFTMQGLSRPLNDTHDMTGPDYGQSDYFSDCWLDLQVNGQPVTADEEWLWHVRRAGVNVSKLRAGTLELFVVDWIPPDIDVMMRLAVIRNGGPRDSAPVDLRVSVFGDASGTGDALSQERDNRRFITVKAFPSGQVSDNSLIIPLGTLRAAEEKVVLVTCAVTQEGKATPDEVEAAARAVSWQESLTTTYQWWKDWFGPLATLECPDPLVPDFLDELLLMARVQQSEQGALAVISRYSIYNIRDDIEPVAMFLDYGAVEDVRRSLAYQYGSTVQEGALYNSTSPSRDISDLPPPPDWDTYPFMLNRNPTEAPCYILFRYWNYYLHTGDLGLVRDRWGFLRSVILRQEVSPEGLMKVNGDEQWRWTFGVGTGFLVPEEVMYTPYSAFLYVPCTEILAQFAELLGDPADAANFRDLGRKVREATEHYYWQEDLGFYACGLFFLDMKPLRQVFEDINTGALWSGYHTSGDERGRRNIDETIKRLLRPDGTLQSPSSGETYTGMLPGIFLQDLSKIDHPRAEEVFNATRLVAQETAEVAEGQWSGDHYPLVVKHDRTGHDTGISARYRPWEGCSNGSGILKYLWGMDQDVARGKLSLHPHLPNGWGSVGGKDVPFGEGRIDFRATDAERVRTLTFTNRTAGDMQLVYTVSVTGEPFYAALVNGFPLEVNGMDREEDTGRYRLHFPPISVASGEILRLEARYGTRSPAFEGPGILAGGYGDLNGDRRGEVLALVSHPDGPEAVASVDLFSMSGGPTASLYDDGFHGDGGPGDGLFGAALPVGPGVAPGRYLFQIKGLDETGRRSLTWPFLSVSAP